MKSHNQLRLHLGFLTLLICTAAWAGKDIRLDYYYDVSKYITNYERITYCFSTEKVSLQVRDDKGIYGFPLGEVERAYFISIFHEDGVSDQEKTEFLRSFIYRMMHNPPQGSTFHPFNGTTEPFEGIHEENEITYSEDDGQVLSLDDEIQSIDPDTIAADPSGIIQIPSDRLDESSAEHLAEDTRRSEATPSSNDNSNNSDSGGSGGGILGALVLMYIIYKFTSKKKDKPDDTGTTNVYAGISDRERRKQEDKARKAQKEIEKQIKREEEVRRKAEKEKLEKIARQEEKKRLEQERERQKELERKKKETKKKEEERRRKEEDDERRRKKRRKGSDNSWLDPAWFHDHGQEM